MITAILMGIGMAMMAVVYIIIGITSVISALFCAITGEEKEKKEEISDEQKEIQRVANMRYHIIDVMNKGSVLYASNDYVAVKDMLAAYRVTGKMVLIRDTKREK